ncbi:MAG TPA: zinc ribbon domain-containing protein [Syntrophomonadaceae bacterium]|nr:zinc ribbon domain-containing protein [Syntrophomonadaceae bacterium]
MPIYEYLCQNCNEKFTVVVSWWKRKQVKCPKCGSSDIKQLFSNFGTIFGHNCSSRPFK